MYSEHSDKKDGFLHKELKEDEIRLVSFRPKSFGNQLEFDVHHYRQSAAPPYVAVSYTWGSLPATESIYLDGKPFPVRPNLWICLYNFRNHCRDEAFTVQPGNLQAPSCERANTELLLDRPTTEKICRHFWIDAICIDQNNKAEKSKQVTQMDKIFGNATMIAVWLGPAQDDFLDSDLSNDDGMPPNAEQTWDWFDKTIDLASRPYWHRLWIVQEILLARHIVLFSGQQCLSWKEFDTLLHRKQAHLRAAHIPWAGLGAETFFQGQISGTMRNKPELYGYLLKYSGCVCKDPRDKVFGLLSLLSFQERAKISKYLPDYSLTHDEVVIIVLAHLERTLQGGGNLKEADELRRALLIPSIGHWHDLCSRSVTLGRLWELEDETGGPRHLWSKVASDRHGSVFHQQWKTLRGRNEGAIGITKFKIRFILWLLVSFGYTDARQLQWSLW